MTRSSSRSALRPLRPLRIPLLATALLLAIALLLAPLVAVADEPGSAAASTTDASAAEAKAREIVGVLASDGYEGRGLGTAGLEKAAVYLEERFAALGLEPAFGDSFRQPLEVKVGVELGEGNELAGVAREDWTPLGFSSSGSFDGELAFVGYGIEAEELGYRELTGLDLEGKVALVLRYEPQERDDDSVFSGRRPSRWSALRYKAYQLRERGAAAVVFATGPLQDEGRDELPVLRNDGPESPAGLPVVQVRTSVAEAWLAAAGVDLAAWQEAVDADLQPRSRAGLGRGLVGTVALEASYETASNVAAVLPGAGALAGEVVVVGAHYDHLGFGGSGSMKPNQHAVHNGADDNASGTAAVLLAARRMQQLLAGAGNRRTVLFALFTAEEVGLAGSGHLVEHFPYERERVAAMVNLDMVGRLADDELSALGADSAEEWRPLVQRLAGELGIEAVLGGDGYGPSDQTSFYAAEVPVIHFFTGAHEQYHTPEDDADTLNYPGLVRVAELTARVASELATTARPPAYVRASSAPAMQGDGRGYGAYLGTVPDYSAMDESEGGVLLTDVRAGGPADLAGIRGGDRIVEMAGREIANLYDMTFALQDNRPGDTIDVVVLRDGAHKTLRATLGDRARMGESPAAAPHGGGEGHGGGAPSHGAGEADPAGHGSPHRDDSSGQGAKAKRHPHPSSPADDAEPDVEPADPPRDPTSDQAPRR